MVLPAVGLVLGLVLTCGFAGMEMVQAQGVAREAARAAAVGSDAGAVAAARAAAGGRRVRVRLDPPEPRRVAGGMVEADVGVTSAVLARLGLEHEFRARATMRVEGP